MRLKGNCCAFNIVALKSRKQMVLKCLGNLRTILFNMFDHQTSPKRFVVGSCFIVIGGSGISLFTSDCEDLFCLDLQDFRVKISRALKHLSCRAYGNQRHVILSANHGRPQGGEEHFLKAHLTCTKDLAKSVNCCPVANIEGIDQFWKKNQHSAEGFLRQPCLYR